MNPGTWVNQEFKEPLPKLLEDKSGLETVGEAGASIWLELTRGVGRFRLGFSVSCDGKSLDEVSAMTLLTLLNGGLIIFIF